MQLTSRRLPERTLFPQRPGVNINTSVDDAALDKLPHLQNVLVEQQAMSAGRRYGARESRKRSLR
jgi:hypothetical protein